MNAPRSKRRWFQFHLRSVLILTLGVAVWLGCEVRQARYVERTLAELAALGGEAECEPTGWSLLRLCRVPRYGQRIVRAAVPGASPDEAIAVLRRLPAGCEVQVTYDGTLDPAPSWRAINDAAAHRKVVPAVIDDARLTGPAFAQRLKRFQFGVVNQRLSAIDLPWLLAQRQPISYHLLVLHDGTLGELLISSPQVPLGWSQKCFAILFVEGQYAASKCFYTNTTNATQDVLLEDLDGDGFVELGFSCQGDPRWYVTRALKGDPRAWLEVYKMDRRGFKSLLPQDSSDSP